MGGEIKGKGEEGEEEVGVGEVFEGVVGFVGEG